MDGGNHYHEMKKTDIPWLKEIPASWRLVKLKRLFSIKKEIAGENGHTVLSVTQTGIRPKDMKDKGQFAADYSKYQLVKSGEFVMNHMDLLTGWVDISQYDGVTSPDYRVFVNTDPDKYVSEYYKYIFQLCYSARIFYGLGKGVAGFGRWRLPAEMFLNFELPCPSVAEQTAIAEYLGDACEKIDCLISEAKDAIEDYKAWKASIIEENVLKGIRGHRKIRSTGLDWVEEIPQEWEINRLKSLFVFGKGLPITKDNLIEAGVPVISYGQIHAKYNTGTALSEELFRFVPETYLTTNPDSLAHEGDFLVADTSEDKAGCGNVVYVDKEMQLFGGYHTIILKAKETSDNKYLAYLFKSNAWRSQIRTRVSGVKLFSISKKILNDVSVILPPLEEQIEIVAYLDKKCGLIDEMILSKTKLIEDLELYKKSLIHEVVTGKRKVV